MIYLKNIIYYIVLALTLPIMFLCAVLAAPFPKGVNRVGKTWTALLLWVLEHVVGLRYEVRGRENIPAAPAIICSKHQSGWETFALQQIFPLQTRLKAQTTRLVDCHLPRRHAYASGRTRTLQTRRRAHGKAV